ncbi:MAG: efflux transporter outer membrane subunit [Chitinophaga sp.]|uniref:efflux transporter outer membrane subunit n=1 Tax=Chitinophaga sp. TaxID=1869181 RepID=UPI0025C43D41|nr:efflux transporter outer membrane subunit [Chitinophaga sp.]MBV8253106.1 efflux transporter outer membrane subunit [Chitinophaga sp.]
MNITKLIYIGLLGSVMVSCSVTKNFQRPDVNLPEKFRHTDMLLRGDTVLVSYREFFKNETLLRLIDTALVKNSDLLIAIKNIDLARAGFRQVKLNYFPELKGQLDATRNTASKNSFNGAMAEGAGATLAYTDFTASLGMSWEIDIWGKIKRQKEEALAGYIQQQEVRKAVQSRLIGDVASGCYNLLLLDQQLQIANRSRALADSTLQIMQVQFRVGEADALGIHQAVAQLEQVKQLSSKIRQDIGLQENALSLLCGVYADTVVRASVAGAELLAHADHYEVAILAGRPDVYASELEVRAANARVGVSLTNLYPALTLSATGGLNALKASDWFSVPASLFSTVAGGLVQPIFHQGRLKLQYEQAKIERDKAVISFRQTVLNAYKEVADANVKAQELGLQLQFAQNREQELQKAVNAAGILFKNGSANYLDIITAESNYLQAGLEAAQLRNEQLLNRIALFQAIGGGMK